MTKKIGTVELKMLKTLHSRGISDSMIAAQLKVGVDIVRKWRNYLGLRPNVRKASRCLMKEDLRELPIHLSSKLNRSLNEYKDEETEFFNAVLAFRNKVHRIPTLLEGFRLAKVLGWRKVE